MKSKFAQALANKLAEKRLKPIDLEKLGATSRQNVSRLLNDTPHSVTGALPKTDEETVEKIAKVLDWDLDEARTAAGYAPENVNFFEVSDGLQIMFENQKFADDEQRRILDTLKLYVAGLRATNRANGLVGSKFDQEDVELISRDVTRKRKIGR